MTPSAPDVSVVIPCFNASEFVADAVERLVTQEGVGLEIVLIDDASTDDTADIITGLAARFPEVRTVLLPQNGGVAAAREAGVAAATADYIWFVDADDTWPQTAAASLLGAATAADADMVCADAVVIAEGRATRPVATLPAADVLDAERGLQALLVGQITGHLWNKLFRRSLLNRIEYTRIRQHSDQAMVAQALVLAQSIAILRECVYEYRLRTGSIIRSGSRRADSLATLGAVVEKCVARVDASALRRTQYRYYRARYSTLSRLKDATSGSYAPEERRRLMRGVRSRMSIGDLAALLRRRDGIRSGLYALALVSPRAYGFLLDKAGGRL